MKGKLFQQIASVALSAALVITWIPSALAAEEVQDVLDLSYDMASNVLDVNVDLASSGLKMIYVMVTPTNIANLEPETLRDEEEVVIRSVSTDTDGVANFEIVLPATFNGRYNANLVAGASTKAIGFAEVPGTSADGLFEQFNNGNYTVTGSIVSSTATEQDKANASAYVAKNIATVTDAQSAVDTYIAGEAIAFVMSGKLTMKEALKLYEANFPMLTETSTYADDFATLKPEVQLKLEEWFEKNGTDDAFDKLYDVNKFMSQYVYTLNGADLGNHVKSRFAASHPIYYSDYNAIGNQVYQELVFEGMWADRNIITDYASAAANFKKHIDIQKQAADDAAGSQGDFSGGGGSYSTGTIGTVPAPVVPATAFNDIQNHWAKASIEAMYTKGLVNGFGDGSFKPEQNVTRAEFAKMIVGLLGLDASGDADFDDIADNSWYNGYVAAAAKAGIVKGADGKFNPNLYITRQDAAVMLARVLEYKGQAMNTKAIDFNDSVKIADYAKNSVNGMANLGIISGYNGGFAPLDNTTRAQAATLLQRVADHIG